MIKIVCKKPHYVCDGLYDLDSWETNVEADISMDDLEMLILNTKNIPSNMKSMLLHNIPFISKIEYDIVMEDEYILYFRNGKNSDILTSWNFVYSLDIWMKKNAEDYDNVPCLIDIRKED